MIYLSGDTIAAMEIPAAEVSDAIVELVRAREDGAFLSRPKLSLNLAKGHFFQALACAAPELNLAASKWVGVARNDPALGLPNVAAMILLSELRTARPLALLDGTYITAARTAATTVAAARFLARPDARRLCLIGAGAQGHSHLAALTEAFPGLTHATIHSRGAAGAARLVAAARGRGLEASIAETPESAVAASDIIVSSVPAAPELDAFLDPAWLCEGAFLSAVDLGRSWLPLTPDSADLCVTDEHDQARQEIAVGKLNFTGRFHADLGDLVSGRSPGRTDARQRIAFVFPGAALTDLAAAALVYRRAVSGGLGTPLD